jgi:uncharacterized membrane protein YtjA (UPF0391 family)
MTFPCCRFVAFNAARRELVPCCSHGGNQPGNGQVIGTERHRFAAQHWENIMLGWAVTFLIVALVAALFGFAGIAAFAVDIARIIFIVAIILFVISAIVALVRGRSPTMP